MSRVIFTIMMVAAAVIGILKEILHILKSKIKGSLKKIKKTFERSKDEKRIRGDGIDNIR